MDSQYDHVFTGLMLFGRRWHKCKTIDHGKRIGKIRMNIVLIEFQDLTRSWCYPNDIKLYSDLSSAELAELREHTRNTIRQLNSSFCPNPDFS